MMNFKHFEDDNRHDTHRSRSTYVGHCRPSQKEIEEEARKNAALNDISYEESLRRLKQYYAEKDREPVKVYHYAKPGDPDYDEAFHEDKEVATALASRRGNEKVYEDFAWPPKEEGEKHVLLTDDELKEYRKTHHRYSS